MKVGGKLTAIASVQDPAHLTLSTPVDPNLPVTQLAPTRETIYQAFFNFVKQAPGIISASRVPQLYTNVDPTQKPFLFIEQMSPGNPRRQGQGIPYNWELDLAIGVFVYSPYPDQVAPVTLLNPIIDAIEEMLPPSPVTQAQTLDGLVVEARLFGDGHDAAGAIGNEAWAYIPARIFAI